MLEQYEASSRMVAFSDAVRAYRQLSIALHNQGVNEHADRFAYRAQFLERQVLKRQAFQRIKGRPHGLGWRMSKFAAYLGSILLDIVSGYGYKPVRSVLTYAVVVLAFAAVYLTLAPANLHLTPIGAIVTSLVSFHGRGFFPGQPDVNGPFMRFVAAEAVLGLLLEITFIATFTQRFFAR
jgi:hypothetical protein